MLVFHFNFSSGNKTTNLTFDEAPASWNTRYIDPNGFECQITLRYETGAELLERAASTIAYLLKNGCIPYVYLNGSARPNGDAKNGTEQNNGTNGTNGTHGTSDNPAWCPLHQCEMKRWDKDGRVWYSPASDSTLSLGRAFLIPQERR